MRERGRPLVLEAVRGALDEARATIAAGGAVDRAELDEAVAARIRTLTAPSLVPLFNLTGTVLHTNLGRAPLPDEAIAAMAAVARGASNLEFDLATGRRGDRHRHVEPRLRRLTGAEAAIVVNNNAAAVLLVLDTLAKRREVPVSRGELIEIGGAFRMPDIMKRAGAKLVEVGTTNRTHPARLRGRDRSAHRAVDEGPHQQLRGGGLHRDGERARALRTSLVVTACRWCRISAAAPSST